MEKSPLTISERSEKAENDSSSSASKKYRPNLINFSKNEKLPPQPGRSFQELLIRPHAETPKPDTLLKPAEKGLTEEQIAERMKSEARPELPSAEEMTAYLEKQNAFDDLEDPVDQVYKHGTIEDLPLTLGEAELPLDANELHDRLQENFQEAPTVNQSAENPDHSERQPTASDSETIEADPTETPEVPPEALTGSNGGEQGPPQPPSFEQTAASPEPEQPSQLEDQPAIANESAVNPQAGFVNPNQARYRYNQVATTEPLLIDQLERQQNELSNTVGHAERLGALGTFLGIANWYGRHRLKKELRKGQKAQNTQIEQLQKAQETTAVHTQQREAGHHTIVERLKKQVDNLTRTIHPTENIIAHPDRTKSPTEWQPVIEADTTTYPTSYLGRETAPEPQRHLESSSWHTFEVNDRTGRVVEQQSFDYGDAFKQEQAKEAWKPQTIQDSNGLAGSGAVGSATTSLVGHTTTNAANQAPSYTGSPNTSYMPTAQGSDGQFTKHQSWIWPVVIILLFVVISAIIIH